MSITIRASNDFSATQELNVATGNFATLWASLGFEPDESGQIDAVMVQNALDRLNINLMIRETREHGNIISCGIRPEQAERYVRCMRCIVNESLQTTGKVYWS